MKVSTMLNTAREYKYFLLIFIAAIALRIIRFQEFALFGHDNSRDLILTYKLFEFGEIIYRGPVFSVVWGNTSPIYYYMLAPFNYLFNFHPLSSAIFSHLINFIAIIFASFISYKFFGRKTALITSIVFSVGALFIINTSSALNPSLMPVFSLGLYYFLTKLIVEGDRKSLIGISACLAFILSLHMSGAFFLPFTFIILIFKKPNIDRKTLLILVAVFVVICILPYLIQEKKMAWWTVKQFIEYFQNSSERKTVGILERFTIFSDSVLLNTSLFLFGKVVKGYIFYTLPIYIYFIVDFIKSVINYKKLTNHSFLTLMLGIYLVTFMLTVPFEKGDFNRLWFAAAFIPLFGLYFGLFISRLTSKKFFYAGFLILAIFVFINVSYIYNFGGSSDSYSHKKEIIELLRIDSSGEDFDIYGSNPEPLYYMLWHSETDSKLKEMYRSWIIWAKPRGESDMFYVITNKPGKDYGEIGDYKTEENIYETSLGYKIIKFSR